MPNSGMSRNRTARNRSFQPAKEAGGIGQRKLGLCDIAPTEIAAIDAPDDDTSFRIPEAGDRFREIVSIILVELRPTTVICRTFEI